MKLKNKEKMERNNQLLW